MVNSSDISVFHRNLLRVRRVRASRKFVEYDFLHQWSKRQLLDRLSDINRNFENAVCIGSRCPIEANDHEKIAHSVTMDITPFPVTPCSSPYICADEEFLPIKTSAPDLILSSLNLHSVNDLPGTLLQIRRALKNDGLFLASMLGGETLHELRQVFMESELAIYGGVSPRIFPFADKPQMGDLLQRAGFALPVVDSDILHVTYNNIFKLMVDLRGMGESNIIAERKKTFDSREFFLHAARLYHEKFASDDRRIPASFEVIFLLGWSPDSSQQKPLRPGSAKHNLADALGGKEFKTGDKVTP